MSEKRFKMIITNADGSFHYLDEITGEKITSTLTLEDKLNELAEENQELKRLIKKMGELGGFNKHMIKTICEGLE